MPPAPRRTLTLELDGHTAELAAEALRGDADRRRRAAMKLSAEIVEAKRTDGTDPRSGAVQVVNALAEADSLALAADALDGAWEAAAPTKPPPKALSAGKASEPGPADASPGDDDDAGEPEATTLPDGSTAIEHGDDELVEQARVALGLAEEPVGVVAAADSTAPPVLPS